MEQNVSEKKTVKDPVCGRDVVPGTARGWDYIYQETVYHFCGSECRSRFDANPKGILAAGGGPPPTISPAASQPEKTSRNSAFREMLKKWRPWFF
jgi:YHS domain-containing protein